MQDKRFKNQGFNMARGDQNEDKPVNAFFLSSALPVRVSLKMPMNFNLGIIVYAKMKLI